MSNTQLVVLSVADERSARDLASILSEIDRRDENVSIVDAAIAMKDYRGKPQTVQLKKAVETRSGSLLGGITSVFREKGIDESIVRKKAQILEPGQVALFVLYTGTWDKSRRALRHALNTFGISFKDGQQETRTRSTPDDDFAYRPRTPRSPNKYSSYHTGYDAATDEDGEMDFQGETFESSIDWPSTSTYGEWTELEGEDPYFGEDSAGFDDDPIFGAESAVADILGDYGAQEPFYRRADEEDEDTFAQDELEEQPIDELPDSNDELYDEPVAELPDADDSDAGTEIDDADADEVAQRTKEEDIALYRGLGDVSPTADEDWLIEEVNKYDAMAEASRAALIAGAAQTAREPDAEEEAATADGIADVVEEASEVDREQEAALLAASAGIAEQSDQIRAFGTLQRETGLELVEIAAELEEFSQEVREQELALLSAVLSNRGDKLHTLAVQMVAAASSASELAETLDSASKTVEQLGVGERTE